MRDFEEGAGNTALGPKLFHGFYGDNGKENGNVYSM